MTRIKICGITRYDDAIAAAEAGVDALGFIFYKKSQRCITPEHAADIIMSMPPYIAIVGVFVNETIGRMNEVADRCRLDYIQLSGDEPPDMVQSLNRKVIKVIRMSETTDLRVLAQYPVTGYLLDTAVEGQFGGTGKTFDWQKAVEAKSYGPIILAGGLHPGNIRDAINTVQPFGIDIASGVEQTPGVKDHHKLQEVIQVCRSETVCP